MGSGMTLSQKSPGGLLIVNIFIKVNKNLKNSVILNLKFSNLVLFIKKFIFYNGNNSRYSI